MSNLEQVKEQLSNLTLRQAAELVKMLEEDWGVTAAAPAAVMMAGAASGAAPAAAEQTEFKVVIVDSGDKKINVIKEIRAITSLGLKEAKDASENTPFVVKEGVSKDEAQKIKAQLEAAGAKVEVK